LGLHARAVAAEGEGSVLVLPRLEPIEVEPSDGGSLALGLLAGGAAARRGTAPIEIEIDGLRPYRDGSPASRIHWPTVARTGEMIERRLDAGAGGRPLVILDASAPASEEALARAVRPAGRQLAAPPRRERVLRGLPGGRPRGGGLLGRRLRWAPPWIPHDAVRRSRERGGVSAGATPVPAHGRAAEGERGAIVARLVA